MKNKMVKTFVASTKRDGYEVKYIIKDWLKEDAKRRVFEMSGEHLTVKEIK